MERLELLFGAGAGWRRPGPTARQRREDVAWALAFWLTGAFGVEVMRSLDAIDGARWGQHLAVASGTVILVGRRSHPLWAAGGATLHLLALSVLSPGVAASLPMQVLYFVALYSGVAWSRERRAVPYVALGIALVTFAYLAWFLALDSGMRELLGNDTPASSGVFSAPVAGVAWVLVTNTIFFGGAFALGQVAWNGALQRARGAEQSATIAAQAERLREQAVVAERLRIARELHDVVAHHVSVTGVQATAARRVLHHDPAAAERALDAVASASRDAVSQMRDLLGTLRAEPEHGGRSPQPVLADLARLVAGASTPTCQVTYDLVADDPDAVDQLPGAVQLTAYRVVQEALANVHRHSTARRARATVRVDEGSVEVEVVDDGRGRHGTAGTGLGHLGMRERVAHLGGTVETGPRSGTEPGYRVRAVLPR